MNLLDALRNSFPAGRLKTSLVDRVAYACDAGFYYLLPVAIVQPIHEAEIKKLFSLSKQFRVPLVFRAAGTSLSGQSITDGILVDISKHWRKGEALQDGQKVRVQPGIIGANVNFLLKKYGRKIGPDPASINSAMMGGILSNNASGMCCGVVYNSYHTISRLRFILPDGSTFDTGVPTDYTRFEVEQANLFGMLQKLRSDLINNAPLLDKIRRKYRMKNTVGYSLNAFVDYEHPLDIFAHLLIGAEGTLGFISEAELQTLPDLPYKSAAMLYFPGIYEACNAIDVLKASGAEALELMDRSALRSVAHLEGLPHFFPLLPQGAAALLCEYQAETDEGLQQLLLKAGNIFADLPLLHEAVFTTDEKTRGFYWKIRKGMFPSVGAVRQRGSTVILEDIAFPVPRLADAVMDTQALFVKHGYNNAIIFGHAKEGNIHFVVTQLLDTEAEIARYDRFMRDVVDLVLTKYDGALKAEHGTGRNMAPFVEAEWGGEAYAMMQQLKQAVDPDELLNPGVILNKDAEAHLKDFKQMPQVEEEVDKCIECGFCEHHCPSRDVTLTPRQRIQVRRHLKQLELNGEHETYAQLLSEYQYAGLDTCATDGLCQMDCPVSINTGDLVKRLRKEQHGAKANKAALLVARHFSKAETILRFALQTGVSFNKLFGRQFMPRLTEGIQNIIPAMPQWWNELGLPPKRIFNKPEKPAYVYLSACIQRMMGNSPEKGSVQAAMLRVCQRAGIDVFLPEQLPGHCCGQAFSSKGFQDAATLKQEQVIDALWQWTNEGHLPVVMDFTSCTYTLLHAGSHLSPAYKEKLNQLIIMDAITFLDKVVAPNLPAIRKKDQVVIHPGCAATKMQLQGTMHALAGHYAEKVVLPPSAGCCGMAGDRGFLFPELTESATKAELSEALMQPADGYYASAKTCEMALTHFSGKDYEHIVYLLDEASN